MPVVQHKTAGKIIMADFDLAKVASEKKILFLYLFLLQRISYKWETEVLLPLPLNTPCGPRHAVNSLFRKVFLNLLPFQ